MELNDCYFPLLNSVEICTDLKKGFKNTDWALLVGAFPRGAGMQRKDLIGLNTKIFIEQGTALNEVAGKDCRVIVVGNPCNTNARVVKKYAPKLNPQNIFAMTYLDENRAKHQIAHHLKCTPQDITKLAVWGNHSKTMYPNFYEAIVKGKKVNEICDDIWLKGEFMATVQDRGAAIIAKRGLSSAASAASALINTIQALINPTPANDYCSICVNSDGSYGVPEGMIFSFPIVSDGKNWKIIKDIKLNEYSQTMLDITKKELENEWEDASSFMS